MSQIPLPKLYKKTSTGASQYWLIEVEGNRITTTWGQVDGKQQKTTEYIKDGKNIGRSNETTPEEQAGLEATSRWENKVKRGYITDLRSARAGKVDTSVITGGVFPMLAHKFSEYGDKITYPAYVQPKLDGHRCLGMPDGSLWSRTRKPIVSVPHISNAIKRCDLGAFVADGELYNHAYHDKFEELTHFINQKKTPAPGYEVVQFHVYDIIMPGTFEARFQWMLANFPKMREDLHILIPVATIKVENEDELMLAFEKFLAMGYEGAIVRNASGLYVNRRSYDLQKIKEFDDGEFKIRGVREGKGKLVGHGVFVCETANKVLFEAKMKGDTSALRDYWEHPEKYVGRELTVQYQGVTKNGIPRFPVGLRLRKDI